MYKIVIDARIIRSSTGRYVERLLTYLEQIDRFNHYIVLVRPEDKAYWRPGNKNFKVVEAPFADFGLGEQLGLNRLLRRLRPDLVHFPMPQHPLLYRGKFVVSLHDLTMLKFTHRKWYELPYIFKRFVFKQVFKHAARRAERIIAPTNFIKNQLTNELSLPAGKVSVIYPAADPMAKSKKRAGRRKPGRFLLYVGQATPYKNLGRLIEAFALISQTHPALSLVIVGKETRWHRLLRAKAERANLGERVIFTGFVPDDELAGYYEAAEAYVFPSLSEGFGLPGLEAMVHGCPVIAAGNGCLPEVYGDAALYFDPLNVDDIATVINRVLSDKKERAKLISAGRVKAGQYSWLEMARQTHAVYQRALRD